jgi:hypothetical protein
MLITKEIKYEELRRQCETPPLSHFPFQGLLTILSSPVHLLAKVPEPKDFTLSTGSSDLQGFHPLVFRGWMASV